MKLSSQVYACSADHSSDRVVGWNCTAEPEKSHETAQRRRTDGGRGHAIKDDGRKERCAARGWC